MDDLGREMAAHLPVVVSIIFGLLTIVNGIGLFFLARLLKALDNITKFMQETEGRLTGLETWRSGHETWATREHATLKDDVRRIETRQFDDTTQGRRRDRRERPR